MNAPQVLVVGGGLAGCAAAASLREAGCAVTLLEREARAGGRAEGDGPFLVNAREERLLTLIEQAGLAGRLLPLRPVALAHARGGRIDPAPPAGRRLEVARIGGVKLREALRLHRLARLLRRFADLLDPEAPERAVRLDDRSAADFVRLYFGPSVLARWAEPILGSDQLADAAEASRVAFLLAIRARGEAPPGTLRGTPGEIAQALVTPDDALGVEARGIERTGAELALDTSGGLRRADAVVVALPAAETARVAAPLLTPAEREGLARLRSVPAVVLHAAAERAPTRKATRVRVPSAEGLPLATVAIEPGDVALVSLVATPAWSRAHLDAADAVVEKELLGALDRIFPGASGSLRSCRIRRWASALPSFGVGTVRELARLRALGAEQRALGRRVYFAGDAWLAPTLEGAVASGRRAAAELRADYAR